MKITVITAFPDFLRSFLSTSIVGRGVERGLLDIRVLDLREYGEGPYRQIDDYSFGGKGGMVLMPDPLSRALDCVEGHPYVVYPSPQGAALTQDILESLYSKDSLAVVCGRYEGIDERFVKSRVDLELSVGDYVLTGGELPSMIVIDALSRLVPGVVGKARSVKEDSFFNGMLDNGHYTRPKVWKGMAAPEVLLSGDDSSVKSWRRKDALSRTLSRRPDLLAKAGVRDYLEKGFYVLWRPEKEPLQSDMEAMARCSGFFGASRFMAVVGDRDAKDRLKTNWNLESQVSPPKFFLSSKKALEWVFEKEKAEALTFSFGTKGPGNPTSWLQGKIQGLKSGRPLVFMFGPGLSGQITIGPLNEDSFDPSGLPTQSLMAVILDRFFGSR